MIDKKSIKRYMANDMNIMLIGERGVGKTAVFVEACKELGYKLKYSQASTTDVFTEFIGIPVPNPELKKVDFYRPSGIEDAEVFFIDELNRADQRMINTVFEIVQFRSINGEPLPKLKCVVSAINPATEEYMVEDLDAALMDRFDVFINVTPAIDVAYFTRRFSAPVAKTVKKWWDKEYATYLKTKKESENTAVYISPRRMEKMVAAYQVIPEISTLKNTKPYGCSSNMFALKKLLDEAFNTEEDLDTPAEMVDIMMLEDSRDLADNIDELRKILEDPNVSSKQKYDICSHSATLLNRNIEAAVIGVKFNFLLERLTPAQQDTLMQGWSKFKRQEIAKYIGKNHTV